MRSRNGVVLVPSDRLQALLPQRSVRENLASALYNRVGRWLRLVKDEEATSGQGRSNGSRSTRGRTGRRGVCPAETSRSSSSADGSRPVSERCCCFDPTRGIDIRTKEQIYELLRELADEGARRSSLHQRARGDPAGIRSGAGDVRRGVVHEQDGATADEARLPRPPTASRRPRRERRSREARLGYLDERTPSGPGRRYGWTTGVWLLLLLLIGWYATLDPRVRQLHDGVDRRRTACPSCTWPVAQAVVVIAGGIDLGAGAMMVLANSVAARPDGRAAVWR